jgi:hypothetical protein
VQLLFQAAQKRRREFGLSFEIGGHHKQILIALGRLLYGENFQVSFAGGCFRIMKCNFDSCYRFHVCCRTEENCGKL